MRYSKMFDAKVIITAAVVVLLIVWGIWVYTKPVSAPKRIAPTPTQNQKASGPPVTAYSVNGTVLKVSSTQITLAIQVPAASSASGHVTSSQQTKLVTINSATKFGFMISKGQPSISDVKVGELIAVTTNTDPTKSTEFAAQQITLDK